MFSCADIGICMYMFYTCDSIYEGSLCKGHIVVDMKKGNMALMQGVFE